MQFSIHAVDTERRIVALQLEAPSEALAREQARSRGLDVFALEAGAGGLGALRLARRGRFSATLFSLELTSLLEAGLNLVEALQTLAEKDAQGERHDVLAALLDAIRRGEPFSRAVGAQPRHFSPFYVATVKAAERTGSLREALSRYLAYQEEIERVKKKVVAASIYPAILLAVGALVMAFLVFYVVPRFAGVYEDMAGTLPLFSRLLLAFGGFVDDNAAAIFLALVLLVAGSAWALSRPAFRHGLNARLWRLPAVGEQMKVYQLSRLYRTAGMLLDAGVPALRALGMVQDLLAAHLRPALAQAMRLVEQGRPMSEAFAAAGLATPVASRMMRVGERGGDMGRMLGQIARFHDDEVARAVEWFTRAFEPVLMACLGLAIGLVVVLMYMPIFELAGSLQ